MVCEAVARVCDTDMAAAKLATYLPEKLKFPEKGRLRTADHKNR